MDFMRNVFAELQVFKRVGHCHDWGASFMSCGIHQHARPFPQLFKLLQLSKRCRMANVAAAIAEAVEAMEAADAAVIQGDAPLIEDGEDEEPAEPARDDGGAGDDQAIQADPADPAVPAVQAQGALVPAGENVVARSMRQEIAEGVMAAVGSTPFHHRGFLNAQGGGTLMHRGHCVHFSGPLSIGNLQCICVYHHPFVHEISGGVSLEISFIVKFYSPPLEAI